MNDETADETFVRLLRIGDRFREESASSRFDDRQRFLFSGQSAANDVLQAVVAFAETT